MTRRPSSAADTSPTRTAGAGGPRRDEQGRVVSLPQLLGVALGYWAVNAVGLIAIDALLSLFGSSSFGDSSGWLTLILPALLFFDDLRAWRSYPRRFLAAPVAALAAVALGLVTAGLGRALVPLVSGGLAGLVAVCVYALVWFVGIRYVTGELAGEEGRGRSS